MPASKSHTIRAVAIASLASSQSFIRKPLDSADTRSAVTAYSAFGATIDTSEPTLWKVNGTGGQIKTPKEVVDVGNSGTTLNIAIGSATLVQKGKTITFTGDKQTQSRPVGPLLNCFNELGANCISINNNGKAPVQITGQIKGGKTSIAAFTSQYLSSLLLCTPLAEKNTEIDVTLLNEPDYVQMTLDWLDKQGIKYENQKMQKFYVKGRQRYKSFDNMVAADFSSATFFLCAAALVGDEVTLLGLDFTDSQPDKAVVDYLKEMGADIGIGPNSITIKAAPLHGIEIDMNRTPDALPAMAVTAAFAEGETRLLNVPQARTKETDRIKCMAEELKKLAVNIEELPDGLIVRRSSLVARRSKLNSQVTGHERRVTKLDGRSDHRIVMALSLAGLVLDSECVIDTAEAMNVTFPNFVELMKSLGADMEIVRA